MSDIFNTLIKSVLLLHCGNKILSVEWYIIFCTGMTYSVRGTHSAKNVQFYSVHSDTLSCLNFLGHSVVNVKSL